MHHCVFSSCRLYIEVNVVQPAVSHLSTVHTTPSYVISPPHAGACPRSSTTPAARPNRLANGNGSGARRQPLPPPPPLPLSLPQHLRYRQPRNLNGIDDVGATATATTAATATEGELGGAYVRSTIDRTNEGALLMMLDGHPTSMYTV